MYRVKTQENYMMPGQYIESQLQQVHIPHNHQFEVEELLDRRIVDGTRSVKVKWVGYGNEYNTYVPLDYIKGSQQDTGKA